jgi:hypothetical protein
MSPSNIESRLKRLEAGCSNGFGRIIVVFSRDGDDVEADRQLAEIARVTGQPITEADDVIMIQRFADGDLPAPTVDNLPLDQIRSCQGSTQ